MQLRNVLFSGVAACCLSFGSLAAAAQTAGTPPQSTPAGPLNAPADFAELARQRLPSVVAVTTRQRIEERNPQLGLENMPFGEQFRNFFERSQPQPRQPRPRGALGSGFILDGEGHIITNNHVVENANEIRVVFQDQTARSARLIGRDPATDIAVLKVEDVPAGFPATQWGDSDAVQPGSWTIAIGSPFGLGGTVTVGVISARSRNIQAGPYDDFLQTDASINSGNSGGPLFNARGEVIGVNTAIFSPSGGSVGIGFAIPSNTARQIALELTKSGRIERGFIGVSFQPVTPTIASALGLSQPNGALVAEVEPDGPAARAGIQAGDVITRFNNQPLEGNRGLPRLVSQIKAGTEVPVQVFRNGQTRDLTLTIGRRETETAQGQNDSDARNQNRRLGVSLDTLDDSARQRFGLAQGQTGVLITQVEPNSPAAESGLRTGDIILGANNKPVTQPGDVAREWQQARSTNKPVLLRVKRDEGTIFIAVDERTG